MPKSRGIKVSRPSPYFSGFREAAEAIENLKPGSTTLNFSAQDKKQAEAIAAIISACLAMNDEAIMHKIMHEWLLPEKSQHNFILQIEAMHETLFGFSWNPSTKTATLVPREPFGKNDKTYLKIALENGLLEKLRAISSPRIIDTMEGEYVCFNFLNTQKAAMVASIFKKMLAANNVANTEQVRLGAEESGLGVDVMVPRKLFSIFRGIGENKSIGSGGLE